MVLVKNLLKQAWLWLAALCGVLLVALKVLLVKQDKLEKAVDDAQARVDAAKEFRNNRKRVADAAIDDLLDILNRGVRDDKEDGAGPGT